MNCSPAPHDDDDSDDDEVLNAVWTLGEDVNENAANYETTFFC